MASSSSSSSSSSTSYTVARAGDKKRRRPFATSSSSDSDDDSDKSKSELEEEEEEQEKEQEVVEGSKGRTHGHQYPNMRLPRGQGLPTVRLTNESLKHHRPRDVVKSDKNGHRCQICAAVGARGKDNTYRNGKPSVPRAKLFCTSALQQSKVGYLMG